MKKDFLQTGREYWLDYSKGCGYIATDKEGIIIQSCPYFYFLLGKHISKVKGRLVELKEVFTGW